MQMAVVGRIVLPILACGRGVPMARLLRLRRSCRCCLCALLSLQSGEDALETTKECVS